MGRDIFTAFHAREMDGKQGVKKERERKKKRIWKGSFFYDVFSRDLEEEREGFLFYFSFPPPLKKAVYYSRYLILKEIKNGLLKKTLNIVIKVQTYF